MIRRAPLLVLLAGLALGGCEDVVDPDAVRGTYELTAVNGEPLPAVMFEGELAPFGNVVATALDGRMTLRELTYSERITVDLVFQGNPLPGREITSSGEYSIEGQLLTFQPEQAGRPSFTGTLQGGVLQIVEQDPDFGELTLTFER